MVTMILAGIGSIALVVIAASLYGAHEERKTRQALRECLITAMCADIDSEWERINGF